MIKFKEEILKKGVVVHCRSEEQAINLLKWADSLGYKWKNGGSYLSDTYWRCYKSSAAYEIKYGYFGPIEFFEDEEGYKILSYEEALLKEVIMKKGDSVYVSDESVKDALKKKKKRIYLSNVGGETPHICVAIAHEHLYPDGDYQTHKWKYAVPIPKEELVPEYTMEELTEKLGHEFKLVKGE